MYNSIRCLGWMKHLYSYFPIMINYQKLWHAVECEGWTRLIRGRISKLVTNGSKTVVMDVIGFLCVSLSGSRVQLHDGLK
jgi:hypothetical protein